jgi:hypothetical protein
VETATAGDEDARVSEKRKMQRIDNERLTRDNSEE